MKYTKVAVVVVQCATRQPENPKEWEYATVDIAKPEQVLLLVFRSISTM